MLEILGYILSVCIGLIIGLTGAGGTILAIPIFIYCFGIRAEMATSYSLFIVAVLSSLGFGLKSRGPINMKNTLAFSIPTLVATYVSRFLIVPIIPEVIFSTQNFDFTKRHFLLSLLILMMAMVSLSLIRNKKISFKWMNAKTGIMSIAFAGLLIGTFTGIIGAGGGFLIFAVLTLMLNIPLKEAVGTTALITALKSMMGTLGDFNASVEFDNKFIAIILLLAIGGVFLGHFVSSKIDGVRLKKSFGWLVLCLAFLIFAVEVKQVFI